MRAMHALPDLRPDEQCCPTDEALMRLISRVVELEGPDGEPTPPDEVRSLIGMRPYLLLCTPSAVCHRHG